MEKHQLRSRNRIFLKENSDISVHDSVDGDSDSDEVMDTENSKNISRRKRR